MHAAKKNTVLGGLFSRVSSKPKQNLFRVSVVTKMSLIRKTYAFMHTFFDAVALSNKGLPYLPVEVRRLIYSFIPVTLELSLQTGTTLVLTLQVTATN